MTKVSLTLIAICIISLLGTPASAHPYDHITLNDDTDINFFIANGVEPIGYAGPSVEDIMTDITRSYSTVPNSYGHDQGKRQGSTVAILRIGYTSTSTPGSPQSQYAVRHDMAYKTWAAKVNNTGGLMIGGVRHMVRLFRYNDGADCNIMEIIYRKMIYEDLVHAVFAPVTFECENVALLANNSISPVTGKYVPFINGADYTLPYLMDDPKSVYNGLVTTRNIVSNYWTSGVACVSAAYKAGARTMFGFYNPEVPDYVPRGYAAARELNMTIVRNATLFSLAKIQASVGCEYFDPFIDEWIKEDADLWIGTASVNSSDFINCVHRRKYHPRAIWAVTGLQPAGTPNSWQAFGSMRISIWLSLLYGGNFTDPLFGDIPGFNSFFKQMWNVTGDLGYQATVATSGTMLGLAFECAGSYDPDAVLACLDSFNETTLLGPLKFIPGTYHLDRPYLCIQQENDTKFDLVYGDLPQVRALVYPWPASGRMLDFFPKAFLDSLKTNKHKTRDLVLIIFFPCFAFLVLVVLGVVGYMFKFKYYAIFVPRDDGLEKGDEWGQ